MANENNEFIVELRDVVKQFPSPEGGLVTAVNHVNLQIKNGEFFSLLGSSGCGKTTCLRMIAGFELPSAGTIAIEGNAMGDTPPYKRPVNTVFQNYALFQHLTIFQNVAFGLEMKNVPKSEITRRAHEALEMVQLTGMNNRKPKQLSGGQQQRVALARALVNRPKLLLLDEPLGALDLKLRKEMQLELKHLQLQTGITFLYVTHDQEEALTMSDRIAIMSKGQVLQLGPPVEIYERPNCRFVADFIGETNFLEGTVQQQFDSIAIVTVGNGHQLQAETEQTLVPGQAVSVTVRPEKIQLAGQTDALSGADDDNWLAGTVTEFVYIGTDTHYNVQLADGSHVRVRGQNSNPTSRPLARAGDNVVLRFARRAARIVVN